jgi:hypothetical protein
MLHRCIVPSISGPPGFGRLPGVFWPRSEVFPGRLLQNGIVDGEIRNHSSKAGVLQFALFQAFGLIDPKSSLLFTPPVIGDVGSLQLPAYRDQRHTLCQKNLGFAKLCNDLFRGILLATHFSLL